MLLRPSLAAAALSTLVLATTGAAGAAQQYGPALSDSELQQLRGGFIASSGLQIDFSFEQRIMVNGEPQVHTLFRMGDGRLPEASVVNLGGDAGGTLINATPLHTVIQNDLDNQALHNARMVNIELSNARSLGTHGLNERLQHGLIQSLR